MKLLQLFFSAFMLMALVSPGSTKSPSNDAECHRQKGRCEYGACRPPWYSIGRCSRSWRYCCKSIYG